MAPEKVTVMILDVDLKCCSCYKKVKKLLCEFPQVRDQAFDKDKNKVRITVVCCNPEKIRDKLCCKGRRAIQRIEIVEDKPKPDKKHKEPKQLKEKPCGKCDKPKPDCKPPPVVVAVPPPVEETKADTPKVDPPKCDPPRRPQPTSMPPVDPHPKPVKIPDPMHGCPPPVCPPASPVPVCCQDCHEGRRGGPCESPVRVCCQDCYEGRRGGPCESPVRVCCQDCYEGRRGGPCESWYGRPVPPPPGPCYDGYGHQYGYGGNRRYYVSRCDYLSEENPQGCSIM